MVFNFRHYIKHSNQLNEFTLGQLKGVLKEYPYLQLARILYLKNLYLLQKTDFENELKKSVPYIYNRPFLHDFLFQQENASAIGTAEESSKEKIFEKDTPTLTVVEKEKEEITTAPKPENEKKQLGNSALEITEEEKQKEKQHPIKRNFSDSVKANISGLLNHQLKEAEKETGELEITQVQMDVEKEYGSELEKVSKRQEDFVLLDDNKLEDIEESVDKKRISNSISYAKDLLDFDYVLKNTIKYSPRTEETDTENKTEKSFTEWLESLNKTPIKSQEAEETGEIEQEETVSSDNIDSSEIKNKIIDSFINTNPALKPKDKPFEYEDISTDSVKEDEDFISDTLARIYYNQGRYDKALEAYQKLSLKYPEKNSYFATQIEKIKNKIKDLK